MMRCLLLIPLFLTLLWNSGCVAAKDVTSQLGIGQSTDRHDQEGQTNIQIDNTSSNPRFPYEVAMTMAVAGTIIVVLLVGRNTDRAVSRALINAIEDYGNPDVKARVDHWSRKLDVRRPTARRVKRWTG